jgi:hypothetical protein
MFRIGQQVVCIKSFGSEDFTHLNLDFTIRLPQEKEIFTIRDIHDFSPFGVGLCFEEFINPVALDRSAKYLVEYSYTTLYFKPIQKTDISLFENMLINVKQKDLIDA